MAIIIFLQKNLRLIDNPALHWASRQQEPIIILYVAEAQNGLGHRWWRDQSLNAFALDLATMQMPLFYHEGAIVPLVQEVKKIYSDAVFVWDDEDAGWEKDIKGAKVFPGNYLFSSSEKSYQRYTPYFKYITQSPVEEPLKKVRFIDAHIPLGALVKQIKQYQVISADMSFSQYNKPGEKEAQKRWKHFLDHDLISYDRSRDLPAQNKTSHLSAALHFGEISVRQIWHDLLKQKSSVGRTRFMQEIVWREFCHQLLKHFSHLTHLPLQEKFTDFWYAKQQDFFDRWKRGMTGFPIVDAGMRELYETGFMHNRVRMIVASFLTKHLGIDWRQGAAWFMERLVDADVAQNYANWQWVAGCGADAAPFFRIFNPILQAKKYDPEAAYIKKWVPELQNVSVKELLSPLQSFDRIRNKYPDQMIDLNEKRDEALAAFKMLGSKKKK